LAEKTPELFSIKLKADLLSMEVGATNGWMISGASTSLQSQDHPTLFSKYILLKVL